MTQKYILFHSQIDSVVRSRIDKSNAVYLDEIVKETALNKEIVFRWLKHNGFTKPCYSGTRWVKAE